MTWSMVNMAVDAAGKRQWQDRLFQYTIAGGDPEQFEPYESSVTDAFTDEMHAQIERELEANPLIRHMP